MPGFDTLIEQKKKEDENLRKLQHASEQRERYVRIELSEYLRSKLWDTELLKVLEFYKPEGFNAIVFDTQTPSNLEVRIGPRFRDGDCSMDMREVDIRVMLSFYRCGFFYGANYVSASALAEEISKFNAFPPGQKIAHIQEGLERTLEVLRYGEELRQLGETRASNMLRRKYLRRV
ncbi:hypothetical protein KY311_00720 [Candidatus Woesearchaeota archaeon]|nr:hypothetical protein [Candidatus Woesearchaeota archaeon]MBW3017496.1 hypothetical protein [Candidatus Woesearchaeota archaeon]